MTDDVRMHRYVKGSKISQNKSCDSLGGTCASVWFLVNGYHLQEIEASSF